MRITPLIIILFVILTIFSESVSAQSAVMRGQITDAQTAERLTAASIILKGTYRGTITNPDGQFEIAVREFPTTLIFRYIGYETKEVEFEQAASDVLIEMQPGTLIMQELVFTGQNPAITIMERVIARKQIWRAELESWKADAYSRQNIRNKDGIVSVTESYSTSWWHREKGFREIITDKRQTNNMLPEDNFAASSYLPNFYDDEIEIAGFRMIGVTNPNALRYYDFKIIERRELQNDLLYVIEVIPKSRLQPLFKGEITVLSSVYALQDVKLTPGPAVFFPPPINNVDFRYSQTFSNYGRDFWLPVDIRIEGTFDIGFPGFRIPEIQLSQVASILNYEVNIPVPDTLFQERRRLRTDTTSVRKSERFSASTENIPLSEEERIAYESIDSTRTLEDAFEPSGLLVRFMNMSASGGSGGGSATVGGSGEGSKNRRIGISNVRPTARYNHAELLYLAVRPQYRHSSGVRAEGLFGYSLGQENFSYGGRISYQQSGWRFFTGYTSDTHERVPSKFFGRSLTSINTLTGRDDYFQLYRRDWLEAGAAYRLDWQRTLAGVTLRMENHSAIGDVNELYVWNKIPRPQMAIPDSRLNSVEISLYGGQQAIPFAVGGRKGFELNIEHSNDVLGSDFNFTRAELVLEYRLDTFLKRRLLPNSLDMRLHGFTSIGTLPVQRFGGFDGNMAGLTPFGTFKTLRFRQLEGNDGLALFWEHNFRTVPFELLGLTKLAENGLGIILFGAHGRTWLDFDRTFPENLATTDGFTGFYEDQWRHEIGLSVNNIFRFMRFDAALRLDRPGYFAGVSLSRFF